MVLEHMLSKELWLHRWRDKRRKGVGCRLQSSPLGFWARVLYCGLVVCRVALGPERVTANAESQVVHVAGARGS